MPSIRSGRDATACASSSRATKPPSVKIRDSGFLLAPSRNAPPRPKQREADHLQHARHHQLPGRHHRRRAPDPLLAVDERGRQHRAAGHRGGQRVAGVEGRLRPPLLDLARPPTSAACAESGRSCASTPAPRPPRPAPTTTWRRRGCERPWPADPTPASTSTASTTTAMPMITHRSHQYLPRVVPSWLRASFTGASWDTPYRVAVEVSDRPLRYRHAPHVWICCTTRRSQPLDPQGSGVGVAPAGDHRVRPSR